jgi:hypothetical protein
VIPGIVIDDRMKGYIESTMAEITHNKSEIGEISGFPGIIQGLKNEIIGEITLFSVKYPRNFFYIIIVTIKKSVRDGSAEMVTFPIALNELPYIRGLNKMKYSLRGEKVSVFLNHDPSSTR